VAFHADVESARTAGFRPCKRCTPEGPSREEQRSAAIADACRHIETSEEIPLLDDLAAAVGLSRFHFHRQFKKITGVTPRAYSASVRSEAARRELQNGASVTEAIYASGFGTSSRFYETAPTRLGMRPGAYRAGGKGEEVRFAIGECSLGHVLVAATSVGICAILLGDEPDALVREVQDRFSNAELIGDDPDFDHYVSVAVGAVERPHDPFPLPLDVRGTAFQEKVWNALRTLRPGTTASYKEIAERIGAPSATRAVAQACGSNRIAIAIPCHRVVRTNGEVSGYRWGVERKHALLKREARHG